MTHTTGNKLNSAGNAERMMNNLLFGGYAVIGMHESKVGTKRNRLRTKAALDAYYLKHPIGILFETHIIDIGVEVRFTPLAQDILETLRLTQDVRERQVHPQPQQLVREMILGEILKRGL